MKSVNGVVRISSPDYVLLDSGTLLTFGGSPTILDVFLKGQLAKIHFIFVDDPSMSGEGKEVEQGTDTLDVTLVNPDYPLGTVHQEQLFLPVFGEDEVWLLFRVVGWDGSKPTQLVYSLYVKGGGTEC